MNDKVRLACRDEVVMLPLGKILPMRLLDDSIRKSHKYRCIEASVRELGLIEPLVVFPQPNSEGAFMLLDGHVRHMILKVMEQPAAKCLIADDDEAFTYNHKVSRPPAIQEHYMILRALKHGLTEAQIAKSLNVDVAGIRQKRDLTKCLVTATPDEQMLDKERPKDVRGLSADDISRMEHETEALGREFRLIEESHGKNTLNLVLVAGYLRKLLDNARIVRYFSQHHPEILVEFQKLVESRSLGDSIRTGTAPVQS